MELYDFIRNDFPKRTVQKEAAVPLVVPAEVQPPAALDKQDEVEAGRIREAEEVLARLQREMDSATVEREMLQHRIAALEDHLDEVKATRDSLELKLQAAESDRNSIHETARYLREKAESFTAEREELLGRIDTLESHVSSLEIEQNTLEAQVNKTASERDNALREAVALASEKAAEIELLKSERDNALREAADLSADNASEIARLTTDNAALQQEIRKSRATMEAIETEKQTFLAEMQSIQKESSTYKKLLTLCVLAIVATLGLIVYLYYYEAAPNIKQSAAVSMSVMPVRAGEFCG
jgi:chromosome segregation ATPase